MDTALPTDLMTLEPGGRRDDWHPAPRPGFVLLDVDGTLMGPDRVVTEPVVRAVRSVVDAGVAVGFATGRNVAGVATAHDQLQIAGPHVVLNGAQVRRGGRAVRTWSLDADHRRAILELCASRGLYAELYTDDAVLVTAMDERYRPHWDEVIGQPLGTVADHPEVAEKTIKATIVAHDDVARDAIIEAVVGLGMNAGAATSPVTPDLTYINITHPDVDKGTAVTVAAEAVGVPLDAVVAIGDGANDLPMLGIVGTAIAMGDAPGVIRQVAHHVVPDVRQDGAATALQAVERWLARTA